MASQSLNFNTAEVEAVADILVHAADVTAAETRKVVAKGALNIKTDARHRISGHPHLRRLPAAVTYDTHETATGAWAEIGPDKNRPQGALGNIAEYGTPKNAPIPFMRPAGEAETPRFERAMQDLAEKALGL
jgi:hypothetical protein